jgi:hypothetical protein
MSSTSGNKLCQGLAMRAAAALILMLLMLPAAAAAQPSKGQPSEDAAFRRWIVHHLLSESRDGNDDNLVYGYAFVDLDGDGRREAIVWARGASRCGSGGCDLEIFVRGKSGWRLRSFTSVTRPPIKLLKSRTHGWRDLAALEAGGGIVRPYEARLRFNGKDYEIESPADWTGREPPPPIQGRDIIRDASIPAFPTKCRHVEEAPSAFGPLPITSDRPC